METENNLEENTGREEISIGPLLKSEREKREISISDLSETIKIREQVIVALENEEWDKLPARVLIKGFIRSYTIAVGCDTRKAIKLFEKCVPQRGEENVRPLAHKTKKGKGIYYVIILLLLLAAVLYLLSLHGKMDNVDTAPQPESEQPATVTEPDTGYLPLVKVEEPLPAPVEPVADSPYQTTETAPVVQAETDVVKAAPADTPPEGARPEVITTEVMVPAPGLRSEDSTPVENIPAQETAQPENAPLNQAETGKTLTAKVNMRTWVKIIADDTPPKEYIFQPGTTHSWRAERGFYVTVGNAGGIEFLFNGETINNLGETGEVKRMRFPDDFQTTWEE
ncbi:MAG: DUF4115 domain-containing protein [Deltaproteobacteria bacterium]|nr:DUF4115 domain-containing protein [Deltaproteobacteria bacterium]